MFARWRAARVAMAGIAALVFVLAVSAPRDATAFDARAAEASTVRVVIAIERDGKLQVAGHGTGFVIDRGYIATNQHVTQPESLVKNKTAYKLYVVNPVLNQALQAEIVWASKELDLSVIKVAGLTLAPLELSNRPALEYPGKGEPVYTVGYPGVSDTLMGSNDPRQQEEVSKQATVTRGVVGRILNAPLGGKVRPIIQHDASFNQGNSGGPLFDACNRIVGVNTFIALSNFQVVKDDKGNPIAQGASPYGTFISPHIGNLVEAVRTVPELRSVSLRLSSEACTEGGSSETSPLVLVFSGVALLVGLAGVGLAVFRRREVVRVVESYSAWVNRKGVQPGAKRTDSARASAAPARPSRAPAARPASPPPVRRAAAIRNDEATEVPGRSGPASDDATEVPGAAAPAVPSAWTFTGTTAKGAAVALTLSVEELERAAGASEHGLVIGRSTTMADRVIDDAGVSRRHARVGWSEDGLTVEDLNSAYGTMVNGTKLVAFQPALVTRGDVVRLGELDLTVG